MSRLLDSRVLSSRALRGVLGIAGLLFLAGCLALGVLIVQGSSALEKVGKELGQAGTATRAQERESLKGDVLALAQTPSLTHAFEALEKGYSAYIPAHLRDMYVTLNPHQGDDLSLLSDTRDGSLYSQAHSEHHSWLREVARAEGLSDLFLVRADGHVIYSVRKGRTFATQVSEGDGELAVREFARVTSATRVKMMGDVEISSEVPSLLGGRELYAAIALSNPEGARLGTLVVQRALRGPTAAPVMRFLSAVQAKWLAGAKLVGFSFVLVSTLLLSGLILLVTRNRPKEQEAELALIPVESAQVETDSARPGSHRSGTRPVLSPSAAPGKDLGTRVSGGR